MTQNFGPVLNTVGRARLLVSPSKSGLVVNVEDWQIWRGNLIAGQEGPVESHRLIGAAPLHVVANKW